MYGGRDILECIGNINKENFSNYLVRLCCFFLVSEMIYYRWIPLLDQCIVKLVLTETHPINISSIAFCGPGP